MAEPDEPRSRPTPVSVDGYTLYLRGGQAFDRLDQAGWDEASRAGCVLPGVQSAWVSGTIGDRVEGATRSVGEYKT
jgi:hypothetical protein